MTKTYRVGVATERIVEVEAESSHEAISAVLKQMEAEGRTVLGAQRVDVVESVADA